VNKTHAGARRITIGLVSCLGSAIVYEVVTITFHAILKLKVSTSLMEGRMEIMHTLGSCNSISKSCACGNARLTAVCGLLVWLLLSQDLPICAINPTSLVRPATGKS
jgi:hypothetical protein